jgi:hypothetical protein
MGPEKPPLLFSFSTFPMRFMLLLIPPLRALTENFKFRMSSMISRLLTVVICRSTKEMHIRLLLE